MPLHFTVWQNVHFVGPSPFFQKLPWFTTLMAKPVFVLFLTVLLPISVGSSLHGQDETVQEPSSGLTSPTIGGAEGATGVTSETKENAAVALETSTTNMVDGSSGAAVTVTPKKKLSLTEELFSNPLNYLLLLIVCVYVYLLFLRPNAGRKESRELMQKLKNLKKNDRVVTTAGIHGIVSNINSEAGTITLRVDENTNTKLTIDRTSIRTVLP